MYAIMCFTLTALRCELPNEHRNDEYNYLTHESLYASWAHLANTQPATMGNTIGAAGPERVDIIPAIAANIDTPAILNMC